MNQKPKDMFGFDDAPTSAIPDELVAGDDRTLRLAAPLFTAEELEQFLEYERALLARLDTAPLRADQWHAHFAASHVAALEAGGLSAARHAQLSAVVAKYCAQVTSRRALSTKQAELRRKLAAIEATGDDPSEDDRDLDQRISTELLRLSSVQPLERRYGKEVVALLEAKQDELVDRHCEIVRRMAHR